MLLPDPDGALDLTDRRWSRALCDRRAGLGADGVLRVVRPAVPDAGGSAATAEWFMDYRNADGSIAEMCGNGVRVFARYLVDAGLAAPGELVSAPAAASAPRRRPRGRRRHGRHGRGPVGGTSHHDVGGADFPASPSTWATRTWPA